MVKYFIRRFLLLIVTFVVIFATIYVLLSYSNFKVWYRGFSSWDYLKWSFEAFWEFAKNVILKWDFGIYRIHEDVYEKVMTELPLTFQMNFLALCIYVPVGIFLGIITAYYHGTWLDKLISYVTVILSSVPSFVIMLFLMLFIGYGKGWFPGRFNNYAETPLELMHALAMPVFAIVLLPIARIMRILRGELIEAENEDYLLLCRIKGLSKFQTMMKHSLRNSILPVFTELPRLIATVLGMSFIVEVIYNLRAAGFLLYASVIAPSLDGNFLSINVPVATTISTVYVMFVLVLAFFTDIIQAFVDPRIQFGSKKSSYEGASN